MSSLALVEKILCDCGGYSRYEGKLIYGYDEIALEEYEDCNNWTQEELTGFLRRKGIKKDLIMKVVEEANINFEIKEPTDSNELWIPDSEIIEKATYILIYSIFGYPKRLQKMNLLSKPIDEFDKDFVSHLKQFYNPRRIRSVTSAASGISQIFCFKNTRGYRLTIIRGALRDFQKGFRFNGSEKDNNEICEKFYDELEKICDSIDEYTISNNNSR